MAGRRYHAPNHHVKLALVTETFPPEINGVAMTFGTIARELGRRGHAVTVFRPRRDDLPAGGPHPEFAEVPMPGFPIPRYPLLRMRKNDRSAAAQALDDDTIAAVAILADVLHDELAT